jgi:hypothetical protein
MQKQPERVIGARGGTAALVPPYLLAKQRDVDIVSRVFRGGAQDAFLIYTEPYLRLIDGIFVRQGSPPLADTCRYLAGKRVAIVRDYS